MLKSRIKPKEKVLQDLEEDQKDTIKKFLAIQDILIDNPPNDKKFNDKSCSYIISFIMLLDNIEDKGYNDDKIIQEINQLYERIFKNRRGKYDITRI